MGCASVSLYFVSDYKSLFKLLRSSLSSLQKPCIRLCSVLSELIKISSWSFSNWTDSCETPTVSYYSLKDCDTRGKEGSVLICQELTASGHHGTSNAPTSVRHSLIVIQRMKDRPALRREPHLILTRNGTSGLKLPGRASRPVRNYITGKK